MNSKKLFYILSGVIVLLVSASIAGVYFGSSFLGTQTKKIVSLRAESMALDEQQKSLVQAKKDIEAYKELENIVKTIVPQEKDQARTVREIVRFSQETGIPVANISFPSSNLGQSTSKKQPAGATSSKSSKSTVSQITPVEGITGVGQLEIKVQSGPAPVSYSSLIELLKRLEQNRRTSHVTNIDIQPSAANRNLVTFTLTVNVYIKQ